MVRGEEWQYERKVTMKEKCNQAELKSMIYGTLGHSSASGLSGLEGEEWKPIDCLHPDC